MLDRKIPRPRLVAQTRRRPAWSEPSPLGAGFSVEHLPLTAAQFATEFDEMTAPGSNVLLHIGYHKTATTLLQRFVFGNAALGFERWGEDEDWSEGRSRVTSIFVVRGPFDRLTSEELAYLDGLARAAAARDHTFVVSHERLCGYFATGGYDSAAIADRLHSAFPRARVLVVLREQRSMILSAYSQFITDGGALTLRRYLRPPQPSTRRAPFFDAGYYEYDKLISYY